MAELVKKVVVDKKGKKRTIHVKMNKSFGMKRKDMPQIKEKHMKGFMEFVERFGGTIDNAEVEVKKLKPTQNEINNTKVKKFQKAKDKKFLYKNVVISNDNYLLDGHHRWAALMGIDSKSKINCVKIDLPMKELIELAGKFSKAKHKGINKGGEK